MGKKRDIDFIPNLGLTETRRDELRKRFGKNRRVPDKVNTADSWTTKECEEKRFSGIRVNRLNGMTEIWAAGKIMAQANTQRIGRNPQLLATLMEEAFSTNGSIVEIDVVKGRVVRKPVER